MKKFILLINLLLVASSSYADVIGSTGTGNTFTSVNVQSNTASGYFTFNRDLGTPANSNIFVAGTYYIDTTSYTNLNATPATFTNLASVTVQGNVLTNNGDVVEGFWAGKTLTGSTSNEFKLIFGSTTLLDTGMQSASNITFTASVKLIRIGVTSARSIATLSWGPQNAPFAFTNSNLVIAETNGIDTVLKMQGASSAANAHTNNYFEVRYYPAPR